MTDSLKSGLAYADAGLSLGVDNGTIAAWPALQLIDAFRKALLSAATIIAVFFKHIDFGCFGLPFPRHSVVLQQRREIPTVKQLFHSRCIFQLLGGSGKFYDRINYNRQICRKKLNETKISESDSAAQTVHCSIGGRAWPFSWCCPVQ